MIGSLRNAQQDIESLKRRQNKTRLFPVNIRLDMSFSIEDSVHLAGYKGFKQALDSLGGEQTEENIQKACEMSDSFNMPEPYKSSLKVGINRASIITDGDSDCADETITIQTKMTRGASRALF